MVVCPDFKKLLEVERNAQKRLSEYLQRFHHGDILILAFGVYDRMKLLI